MGPDILLGVRNRIFGTQARQFLGLTLWPES
jgi:hypothetical protein